MRATLVPAYPELPPKTPFLWRSSLGCIYLRNVDGLDIIICPQKVDQKLGRVAESQARPDIHTAWANRLHPTEIVTLSNDPV